MRGLPPVSALVVALTLVGCNNDYSIYADVSGTVVDAAGKPAAGAVVTRSNAPKLREGETPLTATTDADGHFRLTIHAVGSKPAPQDTWILQAKVGTAVGTVEKTIPWSADRSTCLGYCAKDLTISVK
jgi:uncharacterized lipoprotein NlpE involved in copper resistance